MDPFNLVYLKYFIDAAEKMSVSESSRKNFVTQSCVSQGIKKLEQVLKIDLTMHLKNRFKLTEEGKIVFSKGKEIFKSLDGLLDEIAQFNGEVRGTIAVATTQSLALGFLPKVFQEVGIKYPKVELDIRLGTIEQIHQWIRSEEVDFALILESPEFSKYESHPLAQGEFNLYKHKSLKKWDKVYVDFVSGIAVSDSDYEIVELRSWELVAEFLDSKIGVGVLPDFITLRYKNLIPFQNLNFSYTVCGVYPKGTILKKAAQAILKDCFFSS